MVYSQRGEKINVLKVLGIGVVALFAVVGCATTPVDSLIPHEPDDPEDALSADRSAWPDPPQIPHNFTWNGRYLVPDLGVEVPFTWHGNDGDFQMTAGGDTHPIHFTNLVHEGELFTLTYEWPGIPRQRCSHVGALTIDELNAGFANASFVGAETLHGDVDREVNHYRSVGVIELPPELIDGMDADIPLRIPLMAGDIYSDVTDSEQIWQLLHFGLQNLYDPNLDEWIIIDQASDAPGDVTLPEECVI